MATTDTQLQQLVINVGTDAQIQAGIASGTITQDMLSIATDGADIVYDWVGTLAEYNAQSIATTHPDWLCFITDDVNNSGEDVYNNVYSKTQSDETFVAKVDNIPQYLPNLLEFKWSDHVLNNVSWLRADTFSWQSGELYEAAYNHLVDDISGKSLQSETISGTTIQFYLADDGHKICPAAQENNVATVFTATGVAWYYILDMTNQKFKLPRTKWGFTGLRDSVGGFIPQNVLLPNITGNTHWIGAVLNNNNQSYANGVFSAFDANTGSYAGGGGHSNAAARLSFNASRSSSVYSGDGTNTLIQPKATQMYLYFYVGPFNQDAIENTAGVTTETLNSKADAVDVVYKGHEVIEFQIPTTDNNYTWYRKYADGWVEQGGKTDVMSSNTITTINLPVAMSDTNYTITACERYDGGTSDNNNENYWVSTLSTTTVGVYNSAGGYKQLYWEVKGMAAAVA